MSFWKVSRRIALGSIVGVGAVLSACAPDAADDAAQDESNASATQDLAGDDVPGGDGTALKMGPLTVSGGGTLLAEVPLPDRQGGVSFLEVQPGQIAEVEFGRLDEETPATIEPEYVNSLQRYTYLTGRAAPHALAMAQRRANLKRGLPAEHGTFTPAPRADAAGRFAEQANVKGRAWPQGDHSRTWFRNNYCVPTDRTFFNLDARGDQHWEEEDINYMRSGIYNGSATSTIYGEIYYKAYGPPLKVSGGLYSGWYMALKDSSTTQAWAWSRVANAGNSDDDFDHCINFHF